MEFVDTASLGTASTKAGLRKYTLFINVMIWTSAKKYTPTSQGIQKDVKNLKMVVADLEMSVNTTTKTKSNQSNEQ